jgi:hypothetical protein
MPAEDSRAAALTPPLIPPDPAARDIYWPLRWPRRDGLELGAYPSAVPCARHRAREILREWQLARFTETATIAISELVTNACQATQADRLGTPVRLWMLGDSMSWGSWSGTHPSGIRYRGTPMSLLKAGAVWRWWRPSPAANSTRRSAGDGDSTSRRQISRGAKLSGCSCNLG